VGKLGNILSATKMFLNLLENIFASQEANFVSTDMQQCFPEAGKLGNIDRKQNVSATIFPGIFRYQNLECCVTTCKSKLA
jgi:hypothetical protein